MTKIEYIKTNDVRQSGFSFTESVCCLKIGFLSPFKAYWSEETNLYTICRPSAVAASLGFIEDLNLSKENFDKMCEENYDCFNKIGHTPYVMSMEVLCSEYHLSAFLLGGGVFSAIDRLVTAARWEQKYASANDLAAHVIDELPF